MTHENVLLVLILLVSGYLFCINVHTLRWRTLRSNGYHTFLISASWGIMVIALTYITRLLLNLTTPQFSIVQQILWLGTPNIDFSIQTIVLLELTFGSIIFATMIPWMTYKLSGKFGYDRHRLFQGAFISAQGGPEYSSLLLSSMETGVPVFLTMSDRKVFVGYPIEFKPEDYSELQILPVLSGYRDQITLGFNITVNYADVLKTATSESSNVAPEDFTVTVPIREICHAHMFDIEHYGKFIDRKESA